MAELGGWIGERLDFLISRAPLPTGPSACPTLPDGTLPVRAGDRPAVSWTIPQSQLSDNAPVALQEQLFAHISALGGVTTSQSAISVPGARGLRLNDHGDAPADAFLVPRAGEFAHLHPATDGSLHLALPPALAADAVAKGWAVAHPLAGSRLARGMVMIYGPRNPAELAIVAAIVATSHSYATGTLS